MSRDINVGIGYTSPINIKSDTDSLSIEEKTKLLNRAKNKLKRKYHGIDEQIDTLIDSISGWYLGTTIGNIPTVINMWSITGLGKTSLVRMLMDELRVSNKLIEVTLDNSTQSEESVTVLKRVNRVVGNQRDNLCLFIDEFQNMQTIDKEGNPVRNTPYQDLWNLLSDGRFFTKEDALEMINSLLDSVCGYWVSAHRNLGIALASIGKTDDMTEDLKRSINMWKNRFESFESNYNLRLIGDRSLSAISIRFDNMLYSCGYTKEYNLEDIDEFVKVLSAEEVDKQIYQLYKINLGYERDRVIKLLSNSIFQHINFSTFNTMVDSIKKEATQLISGDMDSLLKTHNMLIIIAGNQDALFYGSRSLMYTYKDINSIYESNIKLKWFDLKQLLLKSLRPEQVSRLGMNHIIYPTLTERAYRQIIDDRLKELSSKVKKLYGINITYTQGMKDIIFRNGAFPTQGVRPLLSIVDSMVGNTVLEMCLKLKTKSVVCDIDENNKKLVLSYGNHKVERNILLEVSDKEDDCNGKSRLRYAVHEAGHALVWMFLTGIEAEVDMAPLSLSTGAWTRGELPDSVNEEVGILHAFYASEISFSLGGRMAEECVFGIDALSAGCYSDLENATTLALNLVRKYGLATQTSSSGCVSFVNPQDFNSPYLMTIDDEQLQREAALIISECRRQVEDIIISCKGVLIDMVEFLQKNVYMSKKQSTVFLKEIDRIRKQKKVKPLKSYNSQKSWKRFKKL